MAEAAGHGELRAVDDAGVEQLARMARSPVVQMQCSILAMEVE